MPKKGDRCIAAIDQGTQSTRVIIYEVKTLSLDVIAVAQLPHKQIMTQAGCAFARDGC